MKNIYQIEGMTCTGCQAKVTYLLNQIQDVQEVEVDFPSGKTSIETPQGLSIEEVKNALKEYSKYQIMDITKANTTNIDTEVKLSWWQTYQPILLIFSYISGISIIIAFQKGSFEVMIFMQTFMAGFFLVFSFFKMLNLKAFVESYAMYDIVAKKWKSWGYIYAFVELGLGIAFLTNFNHLITNWVALIVMSVSIIGVLESVLNKKKIKCACLGAVFNLPMSTVTIIEDALMIIMSALMLIFF